MAVAPALAQYYAKKTAAEIFVRHNLLLPYSPQELLLTPAHVYEKVGSRAISDALLERMFPKLSAIDLWHFTKPNVLPDILKQKKIRLSSVARHLDAGEYRSFIREHGYKGAEDKKLKEKLAGCHFSLCCTKVGSPAQVTHWRDFADGGDGYRLRLHVAPVRADLRRMRYDSDKKSALSKLDEDLKRELGRTFFPHGVSRIAAFSLKQSLAYEDEIRLLVSNPPQSWVHGTGKNRYIELGLNTKNEACRINLRVITCGRVEDVDMIKSLLNQHRIKGVRVDIRKGE